ncbi:MAG: Diguanylate cyclase protein [Rubritepida sp.]|nr:Diguanylate cyclase protein [Rubritepida sp.]
MTRRRPGTLDAHFAMIAAIGLVLAQLGFSYVFTQHMLERELLRSHDAASAQTELLTALAAPGSRVAAALMFVTSRNPALLAARIESMDGQVTHSSSRAGSPAGADWWESPGADHRAQTLVISRAALDPDGVPVGRVSLAWDQRPVFAEAAMRFGVAGAASVLVSLALGGLGVQLLRRRLRRFRLAEEATRDLAMKDPLTGICNRRGLAEALESGDFADAWASGAPMMLALADLDGFKPVNDTYGHAAGDDLLKQIAARLDREVEHQGVAARLGGDEFALMLLLDPEDPIASAEEAAKRLLGVVRLPFVICPDEAGSGGSTISVRVGLSLGIALAHEDAQDSMELMRRADAALYRAKAEGRGRFRRFTPDMDPRLGKRRGAMRLEAELREALAAEILTCHYQPIRHLHSRELVGFEALARWPHATRGFVPPSEFIPIAEANGLIVPLTDILLRAACRHAADWPEPLTLSFNLSPLHLGEKDLPRQVAKVLAETGLPAERLQLELTESALLGDLRTGRAMLTELKALGVRLALDDFGTGHSGLRELQALPFDVIKVDAGFVRAMATDTGARKIVAAIIGLGESLGLPVVAEGIEEEADVDFLGRLGCDMGQGWLFGRPVPADQAIQLMHPLLLVAQQDAA